MRTIIIEDEKPTARMLQRKLEKLQIPVEVLLHSVKEAIVWFEKNPQPDLIFLDIQLSDGLSFEIFEKIKITSAVIFTTAYDEFALRAFKLNSIDYLLKPIDDEDLETAVQKYKSRTYLNSPNTMDLATIRKIITESQEPEYKSRFSIKVGDHIKIIPIDEVELFYSEHKGTYLHTYEGRDYLLDVTLDAIEKDIEPKNFFRVSRKHIIALSAIKDIVVYSNSRLKLTLKSYNKEEVIVSRERVGEFKEWLG